MMGDIRGGWGLSLNLQGGWRSFLLMAGDLMGLAIAWKVAILINRNFSPLPPQFDWGNFLGMPALFWGFGLLMLLVFVGQHFYRSDQEHNYAKQAQSLSNIYLCALIFSYFYNPTVDLPRTLFLPAWLGSVGLIVAMRLVVGLLLDQMQIRASAIKTFLIAPEPRQEELTQAIESRTGCQVVGYLPAGAVHQAHCLQVICQSGAKQVVAVGLPETELASQWYWQLRSAGITLRLVPSSLNMLYRRGQAEIFAGMPSIRIEPQLLGGWEYWTKRVIDILGALIGLVLLAPVMLLIGIAIPLTSEGNPFYGQERMGLHGKVFRMWKFRTMYKDADRRQQELEERNGTAQGKLFKVADDPRVTKLGKFLRRTSLDELPQLFNVLLGDMSLVGPRPLPLREITKFQDWHHMRHLVIPGITGLWQVSGRSNLGSLDEAIRLDLFYIDYWSLNLDLAIILETVRIILFGNGAY